MFDRPVEFEVFIPSNEPDGFDVTMVVEATNWMKALRLGLLRTTREEVPVRNVLCDIVDDSVIHVTDLATKRVFKIREIGAPTQPGSDPGHDARADQVTRPETASANAGDSSEGTARVRSSGFTHPLQMPAVSPEMVEVARAAKRAAGSADSHSRIEAAIVKSTGEPLGLVSQSGVFRTIGSREIAKLSAGEAARVLAERSHPTAERLDLSRIGRDLHAEQRRVTDSSLEEVFLEITELFEGDKTLEQAVGFVLDLAMRHIKAESGSILFTDDLGTGLYFAAARGPKSSELLKHDFLVPIDRGIAGFCARTGATLILSDAPRDPRFYGDIYETVGYVATSLACAAVQCEGRTYGAIEMVNHRESVQFSAADARILDYIGIQTGRFIHNQLTR